MRRLHPQSISSVILLIMGFSQLRIKVHGSECVDVSNPQTRSFETLLNLQANKVSFNTGSSNFVGNYITIEENLENIGRNSFISYSSKYIIKLFLGHRQIRQIEEGAFISLDCLMALDLQQNFIGNITKYTFEGLVILQELNLSDNNLREVPELVFTLMPRLKVLNISRNAIKVLHRDSFFNLSQLQQLDLSYNYLTQFVPDILRFLRKLINLQLGSNLIDRMDFEKWQLPALRTLNLSNNALVSFDTSYEFTFGTTLKELYLQQNYLTQVNPYGLRKHFPNLATIDINDNPWACPHLSPLVMTLNDTRMSFSGSSTDDGPNVDGIACNRTMDTYTKNKALDLEEDTEAPKVGTSTPRSVVSLEVTMEKILISNMQILESIKKLNTVVASLFAIIIIFILIDISVRSDMLNCILCVKSRITRDSSGSSRNLIPNSNENIENSCMLRDRQ